MPARKVASAVLEGRNKRQLIRHLAEGKRTQVALAEMFGVTQSGISKFASKHADEIQALKDDANAQLNALWIADKAERLAVLQQHVEEAQAKGTVVELLRDYLASDEGQALDEGDRQLMMDRLAKAAAQGSSWARVAQTAVRNAAEELGQIPTATKVEVNDNRVTYELVGVDLDKV